MPRIVAAGLPLLLLAPSCITIRSAAPPPPPGDVVVLLPDDQGKTGALVVSGAGEERLLTEPGQAVSVAAALGPGEPFVMPGRQVEALVGPALDALPQPPEQFILYFENNTADLTGESKARIREVLRAIKERAPVDASVVGHTDTVGAKRYNHWLGLERARAVAALLAREGVDPSVLETASHGEDNLLIPTGDEIPEPRNRRVEVTVR